jgi:rRNA maturation RNase YbeY
VIRLEGKKLGSLTFVYCTDSYLRSVNLKYLKTNTLTDVIAFEYNEGKEVGGDVFISVDRVRENAAHYKVPLHTELRRVMVHGLLHLIGYRDKTGKEKALMTEKEDLYLSLHLQ